MPRSGAPNAATPLIVFGLALVLALALSPSAARAQWSTDPPPPPVSEDENALPPGRKRVEITPVVGYQFGGGFSGPEGEIEFPSEFMYGAMLDVWVRPDAQAEFLYTRQETSLR